MIAERIAERLREIERAGLRRTLRPPEGIDFSSNDYIGLARHPLIVSRMSEAIPTEGCGSTGSRLLRGDRDSFRRIEHRFARFKESEQALYFSTGYGANLSALTTFPEEGDVIFSDALNHASLIDGIRLSRARRVIFPHCDWRELERSIAREPAGLLKFVVTESLFSMDGDEAPLREYARICRDHRAALIVDEAHATGVYGARGSGLIEETEIEDSVFLSINTCGKAFGASGAFVCGSAEAVDYLVQRARPFIFSTAPPPLVAAALDAALDVVESEPERRETLLGNAALLRRLLRERGIDVAEGRSQILSVIIGENDAAVEIAAAMQRDGFDVRAIRPPTVPRGTARLRISVNVSLEISTLERFANSLARMAGGCQLAVGGGTDPNLPASPSLSTANRQPSTANRRRGLFVTGTDTNVGKSAVCAAMMIRYRHLAPYYWKPVQTGIECDDDTRIVRRLSGGAVVDRGTRLPRPLSPHLAARLAGESISIDALHAPADEPLIVEGAGGVLVPLNDRETMIDLIAALSLPALVVARNALGTINHTLLTIEALRARAIPIAGVVLAGGLSDDHRAAIEHYGAVRVVDEMPRFESIDDELPRWARASFDRDDVLARYLE